MRVLIVALALVGCGPAEKPAAPAEPIPYCESDVAYAYDPATALTTFPDDHWTVPDASTATGLRVAMSPDDPALAGFTDTYANLLDQLGTLDGFGLSTGALLHFVTAPATVPEVTVLVGEGGAWASRPSTVTPFEYGRALKIAPWQPFPPGARVVVAVRTDPTAADCVSPSPALRALLDPASTEPLADRYAEGLAALGWAPEEVGAMVVFTTQSAEETDAAVAADVAARAVTLDAPATCSDEGTWRDCRGTITVGDYRVDGVVPEGPPEVRSTYALPVAVWLPPASTPGPYPSVLCGHGLGGSKGQCQFLAELAAPVGIAVVAVDAQQHGDHPLRTADGDLDQIMALFGFTLTPPTLDALVWRDNFRASAWDKLQVVRAIEGGMDVDGDGALDLDPTRVQYAGASLGGIMGPELVAWSPVVTAAALVVPGGGLTGLVLDSDTFGVVGTVMTPPEWDADDLVGGVAILQTLLDAGDPVVHAAAVTRRRAESPQAHVAMLLALDDAIVPNSSTAVLAQAYGVAGVGTERYAIPGVTFGPGPLAGNLPDGATGGLLEFAETQPYPDAPYEPADHSTLHESEQAAAVMVPFLTAVFAGETPSLAAPEAGR